MEKNDSFTPQEKKDNHKQTVIVPLMVMAVLLIADLYVMIHMPGNYLVFAIVTILFLVSAYFLGNGILKELQNNKLRAEEQYEAISKSGKASYILLKKAFEQLEEIEGNSKKPAEDIITAQKAIAKVTISRNKENTDALMNSNDKVLEKIFDFEENLGNNQNDLLDKQRDMIDNSMKALMQQQQEIASNMKAMEESIKNELLQAMSSIQVAQPAQPAVDLDLGEPELTADMGLDLGEPEPIADIGLGESEPAIDLDMGLDLGEPESIADIGLGESEPAIDLDMGLDLGEPEPIADIGLGESEPAIDLDMGLDLGEPELTADIGLGESEPAVDFDTGIGESEPVADLDLGEPGLGDALGLGEDLSLEEPTIPEDMDLGMDLLSEEEPEPAAEEDTAMPDLSDPHKLMTPEEIAALIAKM